MNYNRFKKELNKKEYYVIDPKTSRETSIDIKKVVSLAEKALKKAVITGLVAGTLGTGALSYIFADELADFKTGREYNNAIVTMDKEYRSTHDKLEEGSISKLLDDQELCYQAYPDKNLEWIIDGFINAIPKRCSDSHCEECRKNKEIEQEINEIVKQDERYTNIVLEHEHDQEMDKVRGK